MTAKQMLKKINSFLVNEEAKQSGEARKLWDVLSALRGPDSQGPTLKTATTAVIRYHALPAAQSFGQTGRDSPQSAAFRKRYKSYKHFSTHVRMAFQALELKWSEENN